MPEETQHASSNPSSHPPVAQSQAVAPAEPPWWSSKILIATVTATLAAILPLATFIQAAVKERGDFALATKKYEAEEKARAQQQRDSIALQYFDKAIDPARPPTLRLSVLRFLASSTHIDDDIQKWANAEKDEVAKLVQAVARSEESQVSSEAAQLNQTQEQVVELQERKADPVVIAAAKKQLQEQSARVADSEARLRVAQQLTLPQAAPSCTNVRMRSDLRSGIGEATALEACRASSKGRRQGESWLERRDGKAFQCACDS